MLFLRVMSNEHFPARLERLHSTFFLFKSVLEYITASCERQNGTVQIIKYTTSIWNPGKLWVSKEKHPILVRAVDPHSFFADPDPAVLLNADPDPA